VTDAVRSLPLHAQREPAHGRRTVALDGADREPDARGDFRVREPVETELHDAALELGQLGHVRAQQRVLLVMDQLGARPRALAGAARTAVGAEVPARALGETHVLAARLLGGSGLQRTGSVVGGRARGGRPSVRGVTADGSALRWPVRSAWARAWLVKRVSREEQFQDPGEHDAHAKARTGRPSQVARTMLETALPRFVLAT